MLKRQIFIQLIFMKIKLLIMKFDKDEELINFVY